MVKQLIPAIASLILLGSCASLKPLNFTSSKQLASSNANANPTKFINEISVTPSASTISAEPKKEIKETFNTSTESKETQTKEEPNSSPETYINHAADVEVFSAIQQKYASLMKLDVKDVENEALLQGVDEWYGTRYHMGGTTHKGIDCSAFVGAVYLAVYGVALPRVAREQFRVSRRISRTELKEGDLLFFNTRGGISHVGIYLQNNKFIHASKSKGVTVSDMFETYYVQRFVGAGRIDNKQDPLAKN